MSLPQFFLDEQVLADEACEQFPLALSRDDAKHAKVLRLAAGEHIAVVDAAQDYFECEIKAFDGGTPIVSISGHLDAKPLAAHVCLVQGLAKGDKMETVIRHATELGVSEFIPFAASRSIMKVDAKKSASKTERWQAIAKSAAMQSGQTHLAQVHEPMRLSALKDALASFDAVILCWEEAPGTAKLCDALRPVSHIAPSDRLARVAVVVGPEGGLAQEEVDAILACNDHARMVSLGSSILRTETAGIVAPALVLYELGGLGAGERA
ncbi:16S rRNA (uracil(1498)-N(3))-methyltransferase [uncultured Senegalimassilia sp.]|uniref:RsmE family RNA methyltransferase n=1 Tax=uncultured Senegalimassilia sp. TaxID=1714350 RepID=UPI0025DCE515|nr:RsmE family RNA methyltransferase [uncultured Senegalimassilia sp.]